MRVIKHGDFESSVYHLEGPADGPNDGSLPVHLEDLCQKSCAYLNEEQIVNLRNLLLKYATSFSSGDYDLEVQKWWSMKLIQLHAQAPQMLPLHKTATVEQEGKNMLSWGVMSH